MRVLVVEDETLVLFTLEAELSRAGFEVVLACDPASARARLDEEGIGLTGLVVDLNLSADETGFDVARHARTINPRITVIYISGNDPSQWEDQAVEGSAFFAKPILSAEVAAALKARMP
jgi:DNA-binding response OmpR family regulator